jgi:hypothetical protein
MRGREEDEKSWGLRGGRWSEKKRVNVVGDEKTCCRRLHSGQVTQQTAEAHKGQKTETRALEKKEDEGRQRQSDLVKKGVIIVTFDVAYVRLSLIRRRLGRARCETERQETERRFGVSFPFALFLRSNSLCRSQG